MATATRLSKVAAKAAVDAVVDRMENGTGANATIKIYSGAQAASPDTGGTANTLVAIDLGTTTPVFDAATTGTGNYITASASTSVLPKSNTSATASGTAAWFRAFDQGGNAVIDGSVGTSAADMTIDSTSIATGQTVKINSWKVRLQFKG